MRHVGFVKVKYRERERERSGSDDDRACQVSTEQNEVKTEDLNL